jgi:hypothetical protein
MTVGADAFPPDYLYERHKDDFQVEQKAYVIYVPDIELEPLVPIDRVAPVDLRPAGYPRLRFVPTRLLG